MNEELEETHPTSGRPIRRRKATGPRSKQGCRTCRIRRVKCDEQKPSCTKCATTGRWCEWFGDASAAEPSTTSSSDDEAGSKSRLAVAAGAVKILLPPKDSPYSEPEQYRSLQYFRTRTMPQLAGIFSAEFWGQILLQATHHNETLSHAVVALGALHERFEHSDPTILRSNKDRIQGGFALKQYVQAIGSLVKPAATSTAQVDVYLAACILFSSFETLRGHHVSAIKHVHCGVNILAELAGEAPRGAQSAISRPRHPLIPLELLAIMFTRMDTQVRLIMGKSIYPSGLGNAWQQASPGFCDEVPEVFASLGEARNSFDYGCNDICRLLEDIDDRGVKVLQSSGSLPAWEKQRMLARCHKWSNAVDRLVSEKFIDFTPQELRAMQLLKASTIMGVVVLKVSGLDSECSYDDFTADYKRVVDLAEMVIKDDADARRFSRDTTDSKGRVPARFQMDNGVVFMLYELVMKCRDPVIRRRAIALLEEYPSQEGLWDGILTARCSKLIVAAEEGDGGSNMVDGVVPEKFRVSETHMCFDLQERRGRLGLKQPLAGPNCEPLFTEHIISWCQ